MRHYINLSKDNFQLIHPHGNGEIEYDYFKFPGGESHIKFKGPVYQGLDYVLEVDIYTRLQTPEDIVKLLLATDMLKELRTLTDIRLFIPYLPYARQDRAVNKLECFSLKTFANLINAQNYSSVFILDPHSDVGPALINNSRAINNHSFVKQVLFEAAPKNYKLVCPDMGAYKKIFKLAEFLEYTDEVILCNKTRDMKTGEITGTKILTDITEKNATYFIVDDICDGGKTFTEIAKSLKALDPKGHINLIVTHAIMSKGDQELIKAGIENIYATNSFYTEAETTILNTKKVDARTW
jgi:ribose-phosphate pyrophosphokinase